MAKRKGKSQRRIKDWQRFYDGDEDTSDASRRQKVPAPAVKLPAWRQGAMDISEDLPRDEGMIVGMFPGGAIVRRFDGDELLCGIAKTFRAPAGSTPLAIGDVVTVALTHDATDAADADMDRADGMILARQPRRTALARPQPRSGKRQDPYDAETFDKVIAANIDALLIVVATRQPKLRPALIDRFLIVAERGELTPLVVINKIDIAPADEKIMADLRDLGVAVLPCSAATGDGLDALSDALAGKWSVLAGASGVGKSTLVNALVPDADAATREIRAKDNRGRHTTAAAGVYHLPAGGVVIDTPGIRELGLQMGRAELAWYFPEFEPFAPDCRFNDCTHTHEPDCAVIAAVESGSIQPRRYDSYRRILETLA